MARLLYILTLILMDHYTKMMAHFNKLKAYYNPTKAQLMEIISIQDEIIKWLWPKTVSVPFTIEDCEDLRDWGSFNWEFDWVTLDIYNCDTNPREEDNEDSEDPF